MINAETITKVLKRMNGLSDDQVQTMVVQMSREQPLILAYLLAESENEGFGQYESEVFLYIGMVIYEIMKQQPGGVRKITEKKLDDVERANEDVLEKMSSDSPGDFLSAAESMVENYAEPEVLRYLTRALMEDEYGNPDNPPIQEENLGPAFLYLKILLDAFLPSKNKK
jgi:hypothetical protein